ncbi:M81 family metallopeptidase [Bacillus mesophilum]|uniref:M81 family metallopeptidase n=1 Tax=Bacillus mesophilum TaxID=1071718 RepID=UPI00137567BB|nr:M81 family metallopeptidase [Bacillus mesophilum]
MKILIANFTTESNEHIDKKAEITDYLLAYGDDVQDLMHVRNIFKENNVEVIGSLYANAHSSGVVEENTFDFIAKRIFRDVKKYREELDGILLFLHGASKIENLNGSSGEPYIFKGIREIMGENFPIAVAVDPHGNLHKEYCESATIMRSYRESPHTDIAETLQTVAKMLVDLINDNRRTNAVYRKLPIILGGERSVSTDEPVKSINQELNKYEEDSRILSASWHVGYLRHDSQHAGCSIVVVPTSKEHAEYANIVADQLASFVIERRHDFHYHGETINPEDVVEETIKSNNNRIVLTDSGDNSTSGATGINTLLLHKFVNTDEYNDKNILFATINDPYAYNELSHYDIGDSVKVSIGKNLNELSAPVEIEGTIKSRGDVVYYFGSSKKMGDVITLSLKDKPIDVMVATTGISFAEIRQYDIANVNISDYNIVVVKQGYVFPELKKFADQSLMVLTPGTTYQVTEALEFKLIDRPMFPFDELKI